MIRDFRDLVRLLQEHPEWREELRRLVLEEELLRLPEVVARLADRMDTLAQLTAENARLTGELRQEATRVWGAIDALRQEVARAWEAIGELRQEVARVWEAIGELRQEVARAWEAIDALRQEIARIWQEVARVWEAIGELRQEVARAWEAIYALQREVARVWEAIDELRRAVEHLTATTEAQGRRLGRLETMVADLRGRVLEGDYREKAVAYFAPLLRRIRTVDRTRVREMADEAVAQGRLAEGEADDLVMADVFLQGRDRETGEETWAVVEVSAGVGTGDVRRAYSRAQVLARLTGLPVMPVVAGSTLTREARTLARRMGVAQVRNGTLSGASGKPVR